MVTVGQVKSTIGVIKNLVQGGARAASGAAKAKPITALPEFLYHLTPTSTVEKILSSGKLTFSAFETEAKGLAGVYMVDKNNFLSRWFGTKIFGFDVGKMLTAWTAKGKDISVIKIPASKLNPQLLRFRPYATLCGNADDLVEILKIADNPLAQKGIPMTKLSNYITKEPVEYVYTREIPTSLFADIKSAQVAENFMDINKEQVLGLFA